MTKHPDKFIPALRFSSLTRLYDGVIRHTTRESTFKSALLKQTSLKRGSRVLDIGCGTGTLAVALKLAEPTASIVGLDADPDILRLAAAKFERARLDVQLDQGYSTRLPYPDCHFDCVVSTLFFHHLSTADKSASFREALRVLKPGGEIHIADWGKPTSSIMRVLFFGVQLLDGFSTTSDNVEGILPQLALEAGFVDLSVRTNFSTMFGTLSLYSGAKPSLIHDEINA